MKSNFLCIILFSSLFLFNFHAYAQISISNPFEDKAFTINEGQWSKEEIETKRTIFAGAYLQGKQVFITNKGLVFRYLKYHHEKKGFFEKWFERKKEHRENEEEEEEEEFYKNGTYIPRYVYVNYDNCNVSIKPFNELKTKSYTSYSNPNDISKTIKASAYKKITLKNVYPNIDAEFTIKESGGFEYRFILKPNSNVSDIKISYKGVENISINANNELNYRIDENSKLTETKPLAFEKATKKEINCLRILKNKTQTFSLANYNKTNEIIIDPIVFDPTLTSYNRVYDISKDNTGNIFVFGGLCPYVLKKFDNSGNLLWSFDWSTQPTPTTLYGDFAIDQNGNTITVQGYPDGRIIKLDPNGTQIFNVIMPGTTTATEMWRIAYNCDYSVIRLSGLIDVNGVYKQIVNIDPTNGNLISSSPNAVDESRALYIDPNGEIYSLTPTQGFTGNPTTNYFTKFDVALNSVYRVVSGYNTSEASGIYHNVTYAGGTYPYSSMNGLTADINNVYTYDGSTIFKRRQSLGNSVGSIVIPNGITLGNSGIVIDPCYNIFVGTQNGVVQLDTNLNIINTIATPAQVYDLCLYNGNVLATGNGFVSELNFNTNCKLSIVTSTVANTSCDTPNGQASVSTPTNGVAPYTYLWNTGATTQSISNLTGGKYWVTVKDAFCGNPKIATDTVIVPNFTVIPVPSFTYNSACFGAPVSFTDTSTPNSGPNEITNWIWDFNNDGNLDNFTQNPSYVFPTAGTYTVNLYTAIISSGCFANIIQTVSINPPPSVYVINTNSQCDTIKIDWINFNTVTPTSASGSVGGYSINATQTNPGLFAHSGMFGVGNFPSQYSVATITNAIANNQAGLFTFCFNEPVINPQICLSSVGQGGIPVPVNTSVPYEVVWPGIAMTYPNNTQFIGEEGYTIIKFPGVHTCISFDYLVTENYCTIGFGLMDVNCQKDTICPNEPVAFLAKGASTYTWNTGATTNTLLVNPTVNSQYTVTGTNQFGCSNSNTVSIDVYTVSPITVNNASICIGQQTATLNATGAVTYTWNNPATLSSSTGSIVTANPNTSTDYTITSIDKNECIVTTTANVHVYQLPNVSASTNSLCIGNSAPLNADGAASYTWEASNTLNSSNGTTVIASPTVTSNYTVTGEDANGCTNTATTTVVVNPLPIITVTSNTICIGKSGDLIANGAVTYTWNSPTTLSSNTGNTVIANPITTTDYTVIGTDNNGCVNSATTTVSVNNLPNVSVTPSFSMCSANTGTLTASGATNYTWSPSNTLSSSTGSFVTANQTANQTYTVIGEDITTTCTNSAVTTISITTTPTVIAIATPTMLCPQQSSTLTANGASTYLWLPFMTLGNSVIASPTVNTTYTVVGANGSCTNTAEVAISVTVNPTIVATTETICSGSSANLTASGGISYTWTPSLYLSSNQGAAITSSAPITTQYVVIGTSPLGCKNSATVDVTVVSTPTITVIGNPLTICTGSTSVLTANGASSYSWSPAGSIDNPNNASVVASPSVTTIYSVIGENSLGTTHCIDTKTIQVIVRPKINPLMSPNDQICEGQTTKIYAKGGNVYHWQPTTGVSKPNDSVTVVKPTVTTIYTVSVSYNNLCPETGTVQVTINPLPIIDAGKDSTINIDESIVLQGTGNVNVGFLSPDGNPLVCNWCSVVEVFPKENTCYTLEGYTDKGCRATDDVCITITKDWDVYIPNAFSPNNGDNVNDYFLPQGFGIKGIDLYIFDRWGTKIYEEIDTKLGWDGKYKNIICQQGVYVYKVTIKAMNGEVTERTGHVTLLGKSK